jgi:hypothetical protein
LNVSPASRDEASALHNELAGLRLRERGEPCAERAGVSLLTAKRRLRHHRDRREILQRVVRQLLTRRRIERVTRRDESERVAIRRRTGDLFRSDDRLGARPVLDDDGLIPSLGEAFGQQARDVVGAAAGPVWNNQLHRRGRERLGDRDG